jgi:hypothetical protein
MAITQVGSITGPVTQIGTNLTVTEPAGCQADDYLVVWIAHKGTVGYQALNGWIKLENQSIGNTDSTDGIASGELFYIKRGASAPNLTFIWETELGDVAMGMCAAFRGIHLTDPIRASTSKTAAIGATVATETALSASIGDLCFMGLAGGDAYTFSAEQINGVPTALNELADNNTTTGSDTTNAVAALVLTLDITSQTLQATCSSALGRNVIAVAYFKPTANAYTLACDYGTYALTGQPVTFKRTYVLAAEQGSYALAGQAVVLHKGYTLVAGLGTYALTGQPVTFKRTYVLAAGQGSYALAGQAVVLTRSYAITGLQGSEYLRWKLSERVIIFSKTGIPLAELSAPVVRNWKLEYAVSAERAVFELDPADIRGGFLDYGNFIGVFSDDLPNWAGVIWPPQTWPGGGKVLVEAKGAEYVTSFRVTGVNDRISGTGGLIFAKLLTSIQSSGWRPHLPLVIIDETNIIHSGKHVTITYHRERLFDAFNDLAEETGQYWWLEPELDPRGRLRLVAFWQAKRGRKWPKRLIEGSNFTPDQVLETGDIVNRLYGIGKQKGWTHPLEVAVNDMDSISDYGLIEDVFIDESADPNTLLTRAARRLQKRSRPRIMITGSIYKTPYPWIGDLVDVQLSYELYTAKGVNLGRLVEDIQLTEMSYSSAEKMAAVTLDSAGINDEGE